MAEFMKEAPKFVTARECVTRAVKTLEAHTHETLKKLRHTISDTFSGQNVRVRTPLARWRTKLSELLTTTSTKISPNAPNNNCRFGQRFPRQRRVIDSAPGSQRARGKRDTDKEPYIIYVFSAASLPERKHISLMEKETRARNKYAKGQNAKGECGVSA
jgi:hypothetical protein